MFWIPQGWVPSYIERILAFPRAPTGSISMQVWWIACTTFIALVSEAVVALYTLVQRQGQKTAPRKEPMAHKSGTASEKIGADEKKER